MDMMAGRMRWIPVLGLLVLAACSAASETPTAPIATAGATNVDAQTKELAEKGVIPTDSADAAAVARAFGIQADAMTKKAGGLDTIDLVIVPTDLKARHAFVRYLLDNEWLLVKKEQTTEGTRFRFIRPTGVRVDVPLDGSQPVVPSNGRAPK